MFTNPYQILGVPNNSDKAVCKKAFRKLCIKYHPDNNGGDESKFHDINEAWKQIESGNIIKKPMIKNSKYVLHKTLFIYQFA